MQNLFDVDILESKSFKGDIFVSPLIKAMICSSNDRYISLRCTDYEEKSAYIN